MKESKVQHFTNYDSLFLNSQMKITYDDQYLVTVSEDACVMIWKIQDKEGRGLKRDKEVGYAEEILITKSDLEEKVQRRKLCVVINVCVKSCCISFVVVDIMEFHLEHLILELYDGRTKNSS